MLYLNIAFCTISMIFAQYLNIFTSGKKHQNRTVQIKFPLENGTGHYRDNPLMRVGDSEENPQRQPKGETS